MPDTEKSQPSPGNAASQGRLEAIGARVLAVGLVASQIEPLMNEPPLSCVYARYAQMTDAFLVRMAADLVVAPLFGPDFDVLDLVDRLVAAGFGGRLLAVTTSLPRPDAVRAEVRAHAAGIEFDLLVVGADGKA